MDAIVAVYDDWGIGRDGTQPVALSADRKFFRRTTAGATVIVGRRTLQDFPGGRPLPGRENLVLSRRVSEIPGAQICRSPAEAATLARERDRAFVIGGESIYRQMLPYCRGAYVTKIRAKPESDVFFPDLDADPAWTREKLLEVGEENGIAYEIWHYLRKEEQ